MAKIMTKRTNSTLNKCLFIDRDGTINKFNSGYNYKKEHIQLIPGVEKLLSKFCKRGYKIIVITNQGGIGMGLYSHKAVHTVNRYIDQLLRGNGAGIDGFYYCPHNEKDGVGKYKVNCSCRKPGNLLLEKAITDFNADRKSSLFLGDNFTDKLCADKSNIAFYPIDFRAVKTTSQGFRVEIEEYSDELINSILAFAERLNQN